MSLITFDWAQIAYVQSPLPVPWWAQANTAFAVVFFYWLITPILYVSNDDISQKATLTSS